MKAIFAAALAAFAAPALAATPAELQVMTLEQGVWDADITYEDPKDRYRVSAFMKNVTNKTHLINANPIAGLFNANYYADPKVYGVELAVTFR